MCLAKDHDRVDPLPDLPAFGKLPDRRLAFVGKTVERVKGVAAVFENEVDLAVLQALEGREDFLAGAVVPFLRVGGRPGHGDFGISFPLLGDQHAILEAEDLFGIHVLAAFLALFAADGGAFVDPPGDGHDFLGGERIALVLGRHGAFFVMRLGDRHEQVAGIPLAGDDDIVLGEALEEARRVVEAQAAFDLLRLGTVAVVALRLENRHDVLLVVERCSGKSETRRKEEREEGRAAHGDVMA